MNYIGIDIGSTASKVVVRGSKEAYFVLPTGWSSKETAQTIRARLREMEIMWRMRQPRWLPQDMAES